METQDLIYLLSCAVNGEAPDEARVAGMDLDAVYRLASRHTLAATVAPVLKAAGVTDQRFSKALEHSALKNAQMDMEMDAVFAALDAAGIWHMPLKGIVLQHLYPVYGMRQMSDHDILIDAGRAGDIRVIMENLGFHTEHFGTSKHDVYYKPPVSNFQMHRTLFDVARDKKYEYFLDVPKRLLGEGYEKRLSPEDFYLYIIAHEYKHYSSAGTGLRSLLDTYVYLQKEKLDMAYVTAEAEKLDMAAFEAANRSLARHLFSGGELTADDKALLEDILAAGTFGSQARRAERGIARNGGSKLRYALKRFLAPFDKNSNSYPRFVQKYPFFYRHKLFLPLLAFPLFFRAVKTGWLKTEVKAIKNAKT